MAAGSYSVQAAVMEGGKQVKGTLTLFSDEYIFAGTRCAVNWERAECRRGTVMVKSFLFSAEKPCVTIREGESVSPAFLLEKENVKELLDAVEAFAQEIRSRRLAEEARLRAADEEKRRREAAERAVREAALRQEAEEKRKAHEALLAQRERRRQEEANREQKLAQKKERLARAVENARQQPETAVAVEGAARKAAAVFLDNPYRVLGISCTASGEEANNALDKLKKLARLKALGAYRSGFDLRGFAPPVRELSVAQNALTLLKDPAHRWFWFRSADACAAWQSGKYRMELSRDGQEYGDYDLFLANYLYALTCDSDFGTPETWKRVLNYTSYLCREPGCVQLRSRFPGTELSDGELVNQFRNQIFKPLLLLCGGEDVLAVLRLHRYIRDCGDKLLEGLARKVMGRITGWFTGREESMMAFLREFSDEKTLSAKQGRDIRARGEEYLRAVSPVLGDVLKALQSEPVRSDMVKESYRSVTYELMFQLNKCANKTDAIYFANKTYQYCDEDVRRRIRNTFGFANIKVNDLSLAHTGWDIWGDNYYRGENGCAQDYAQAVYWYHKAADEGNMYSQNSLGLCYQNGHGVPQSHEQAADWFEKARRSGNPEGAYNLAECYYSGTGRAKNIDRALELWTEAEKLGHPNAADRRAQVEQKVRGERRAHRARNHICVDIGFQMPMQQELTAEVTLSGSAYVYLVDGSNYQRYLAGDRFDSKGGWASTSPYRVRIPNAKHWYVVVDNGDASIAGLTAAVKVRNG